MNIKSLLSFPSPIQETYSLPFSVKDRIGEILDNFVLDKALPIRGSLLTTFPALVVSENDESIIVKAELPSIAQEDVRIDISKNRMIISGEKKSETNEENNTYHICEVSYGKFSRSLAFPFNIDAKKTKASFNKGVLTVTIQKPDVEANQSQSIPISTQE